MDLIPVELITRWMTKMPNARQTRSYIGNIFYLERNLKFGPPFQLWLLFWRYIPETTQSIRTCSPMAFNVQYLFQTLALTSAVLVYIRDEDFRIMFHFDPVHIVRRTA